MDQIDSFAQIFDELFVFRWIDAEGLHKDHGKRDEDVLLTQDTGNCSSEARIFVFDALVPLFDFRIWFKLFLASELQGVKDNL